MSNCIYDDFDLSGFLVYFLTELFLVKVYVSFEDRKIPNQTPILLKNRMAAVEIDAQ